MSKKITLPGGCSMSVPAVHPRNWLSKNADLSKPWQIHFRFYDPMYLYDPQYKGRLQRTVKGMNHIVTHRERVAYTRRVIDFILDQYQGGYNPITRKSSSPISPLNFELSPQTPFIEALWKASQEIKVSHGYLLDVQGIIRGVERAAAILNIKKVPVASVTRKYISGILKVCGEQNKRWSARRHNSYRTALLCLFRQLIQFEAVDVNPVKDVLKMTEIKKERVLLSMEDREKINTLVNTDYPFWRLIQIFFHSGARERELLQVKGKHIDIKNQSVLYTVRKGQSVREVRRPIKDIVLELWKELKSACKDEDYTFSRGLVPGPELIAAAQITRRWRRHIKKKMGIKGDFYGLKHLQVTEMMDLLDDEKEVLKLTGHTSEAMIISIYDKNNRQRKDNKIKAVWNAF